MSTRISPDSGKLLMRDVRRITLKYKDQSITFDMPGWYADDDDDDAIFSGIDMKVSDAALETMKARHLAAAQQKEGR